MHVFIFGERDETSMTAMVSPLETRVLTWNQFNSLLVV